MTIFLGADIGTTSAKCLAVDDEGSILAEAQDPYGMSHPHQGWAEQDPEDFWRGLVSVVRGCLEQLRSCGREPESVAALALSTQGDTLIAADRCGRPLRPAISWMDARSSAECARLLAEADQRFWYSETGIRLTPYSSACAVLWLAENEPETLRDGVVCWVPDFLAWRMTGRRVADVPSASWTPFFNPFARRWSGKVAQMVGLLVEYLPETAEAGEPIGCLSRDAAAELGLPEKTPVVAGAFDQAAAAHGAGAAPGGRWVLSCGTAWVLYAVALRPPRDPEGNLPVCCHVQSDAWGLVLPFSGGTVFDWVRRTFGADGAASEADSGKDPLIFIPHLYGGLCPDWREESKGTLVGLTLSHTAADIELAVMRGLAFEARRNLEAAAPLAGGPERLRMVGGATKSALWPQLIADILGLPVEVLDCAESACYGAARLAAGGCPAAWTGRVVRVVEPQPSRVEAEREFYGRYLDAYRRALEFYRA
ncbi:MAG: xylulokinase [Armatimonadota bacterium]|nr:MAG: xylulokinase [Armatimonadota bacterium]